jgi:MFS transporter, NNP family, nitrate/nitrite transporter
MNPRDLRRAGHWPSLLCSFLYFDISCMIWVLLGALGNALSDAFHLSPSQKGLMVAVPILGGAGLRIVLGVLTDRIGARRTALLGMAITAVPLLLGWLWADSFPQLLLVGLLLGVAGASFAAALPLASRWYPPEQQGLVLGIAGVGNSGTALATLFAPPLVPLVGWRGVFGLALIPVAIVFLVFAALAKDAPSQPAPKRLRDYLDVLVLRDTYWFCGFYAVTFGGFVGLTSFLSIFFRDQYGTSPVRAGLFATVCVLAGSLLRPLGGLLADRLGGIAILVGTYVGLGFLGLTMSYIPHLSTAALDLFLIMALLGMGNGAVFQLVPQRFQDEIGVVTGLVGAAGGLGGFVLPMVLGLSREWAGRFGPGFFLIGVAGFAAAGLLLQASREWQAKRLSAAGMAEPLDAIETAPPALAEVGAERD